MRYLALCHLLIAMKCKMRLSIWNVLFHFSLIINIAKSCGPLPNEAKDAVTLQSRNAAVKVELRGGLIILSIVKSDGTNMRNVLHTKESDELDITLTLDQTCKEDSVCIKQGNVTLTTISAVQSNEIINVTRNIPNPDGELIDCYELGNDIDWYGGPQLRHQHWPIQNMYFEEEPYVPSHPQNMAIAERYWLSSKGIYIYVDYTDPLFLDQNNYKQRNLCLISKNKAPYRKRDVITLQYEIGIFDNPRIAHEYVVSQHFGRPTGRPNDRMIRHPVWSTWARYKANVNEEVIRQFADEIVAHGFNNSQLEIDDNWERCYGSAEFDDEKFNDITALMDDLKAKGFRVTLWIHPFINEGCEPAYHYAMANSYFVKSVDGNVQMQWWQGANAATIDFTNPAAVSWWVERLKYLQELGIDSFKFDAGEPSWLPQVASLNNAINVQPGIFTEAYVNSLADNFDDNIEVRVGWRSQDLPIFVRMIDKDTGWTMNNGLPTLITTLLQMNLNGYVHVLPDMIGGNGYLNYSLNDTFLPSKELFIRWLQANVFMPALQYSFVPWDFDNETVNISKKFTDLHAEITPMVLEAMNKSIETGTPVNNPIWWIDPTNPIAHKITDEFLLGEGILVAPVIEEGAVTRDIYLPKGRWRDANSAITYNGPTWIYDYPAPLNVLPYFTKV